MNITINAKEYTVNKIWYISPDGNDDTGSGTKDNPYYSMNKAYISCSSGMLYV